MKIRNNNWIKEGNNYYMIRLRQPYWSAWQVYGWESNVPGIGISAEMVNRALRERCGSTKSLIIHHKDGSRKTKGLYNMNNDLSNLITLCRHCHSRVHGVVSNYHDIPELREMGYSFQKIGDILKISRQRVHQIYCMYLKDKLINLT
jgi:hypothetical protein